MILEIIQISLIASMFSFLGEPGYPFSFYRKWIMRLPDWLNKPLGSCNLCVTGEACLWYYLIAHFENYQVASLKFIGVSNFLGVTDAIKAVGNVCIDHLFFVAAGIFLSSIYSLIYYAQND